jgi:hypothetical protein
MNKYVLLGNVYVDSVCVLLTYTFFHIKDKEEVAKELQELRENSGKKVVYFCKIPVYPVGQYEVLTLEEWFDKFCENK